jgi:hypothetical protein
MEELFFKIFEAELASFVEHIILGSGSVLAVLAFKYIKSLSSVKTKSNALDKIGSVVLDYAKSNDPLPNEDILKKILDSLDDKEKKETKLDMDKGNNEQAREKESVNK